MEKSVEENITEDETIIVTIEYKGKKYTSRRKFSDKAIEISGYPDMHLKEASNGAMKCMRDALVAEKKIKK